MIPAGQIPATDKAAAKLFELSVSRYRALKRWQDFPAQVQPLHRPGAKTRIYDLGQLTVVARNEKAAKQHTTAFEEPIPALARDPQILEATAAEPTLRTDEHGRPPELQPGDLLDRDEAYAALPDADRPKYSTWLRLVAPPSGGATTKGPEPTEILDGTVRLWSYGALLDWNSKRTPVHATGHGHHRPKGSKDTKPRANVIARTEQTRRLLADNPHLTDEQLATALDVSIRTAEKHRAAAEAQ